MEAHRRPQLERSRRVVASQLDRGRKRSLRRVPVGRLLKLAQEPVTLRLPRMLVAFFRDGEGLAKLRKRALDLPGPRRDVGDEEQVVGPSRAAGGRVRG